MPRMEAAEATTSEEWRAVPFSCFAGFEASNLGRFRRWQTGSGRALSTPVPVALECCKGIMRLCRYGRGDVVIRRSAAGLVLAAFGQPKPNYGSLVRFVDRDRSNLALKNLAWRFSPREGRRWATKAFRAHHAAELVAPTPDAFRELPQTKGNACRLSLSQK